MKIAHFILFLILVLLPCNQAQASSRPELTNALYDLLKHIEGISPLNAEQIDQRAQIIAKDIEHIGSTPLVIRQAFAVTDAYEKEIGPLFMNDATRRGFSRKATGGLEIHRAIFALQQGLLDYAYTSSNVQQYYRLLNGPMFKTSSYFPGAVMQQPDHTITHINDQRITAKGLGEPSYVCRSFSAPTDWLLSSSWINCPSHSATSIGQSGLFDPRWCAFVGPKEKAYNQALRQGIIDLSDRID